MRHQTSETRGIDNFIYLELQESDVIQYLLALCEHIGAIKSKYKNKKLSRVDVAIISRSFFYNYFSSGLPINSDPFSTIVVRDEEQDTPETDRFDYLMKRYVTCDVLKYFGINFMQFLELPTVYAEKILEFAGKCKKEVDSIAEKINRESERKLKKNED